VIVLQIKHHQAMKLTVNMDHFCTIKPIMITLWSSSN